MADELQSYMNDSKAQFNGSVLKLFRINDLVKKINECTSLRSNYTGINLLKLYKVQFANLEALYKELSSEIKSEKDRDKHFDKMITLKNKINSLKPFKDKVDVSWVNEMDKWEIDLRQIQKERGLDMIDQKDGRFALNRN